MIKKNPFRISLKMKRKPILTVDSCENLFLFKHAMFKVTRFWLPPNVKIITEFLVTVV